MENLRITGWDPKIEGLRGFSILLVFVPHLFGKNSYNWGALGVAIFFVISGYVITGSITKQVITQSTDQISLISFLKVFYIRRGKRLLPLAIAVILSAFLISLFDPNSDKKQYFLSAIFCLLYIGNVFGFTFGYTDLAPALGHFWSLAVEEQFYFIWPILFFIAIKKNKEKVYVSLPSCINDWPDTAKSPLNIPRQQNSLDTSYNIFRFTIVGMLLESSQ